MVAETHPWAKRRTVELSELHRQRLVQLPDTYVMRRMTDEICRNHRIRPRTVAEINSIEMVLRSLGPLNAVALMPRVTMREAGTAQAAGHPHWQGKSLGLEIGLLRLIDSGTNTAVAAFSKLAQAIVPKIIEASGKKAARE